MRTGKNAKTISPVGEEEEETERFRGELQTCQKRIKTPLLVHVVSMSCFGMFTQ